MRVSFLDRTSYANRLLSIGSTRPTRVHTDPVYYCSTSLMSYQLACDVRDIYKTLSGDGFGSHIHRSLASIFATSCRVAASDVPGQSSVFKSIISSSRDLPVPPGNPLSVRVRSVGNRFVREKFTAVVRVWGQMEHIPGNTNPLHTSVCFKKPPSL